MVAQAAVVQDCVDGPSFEDGMPRDGYGGKTVSAHDGVSCAFPNELPAVLLEELDQAIVGAIAWGLRQRLLPAEGRNGIAHR
jgi:hypothetical protein